MVSIYRKKKLLYLCFFDLKVSLNFIKYHAFETK